MTERLVRANGALGARGASRSRVRRLVGRGRRGAGGGSEGGWGPMGGSVSSIV